MGWQAHLKLPITATIDASGRKIFTLVPGVLQKGASSFFKAMGIFTGVGITKDLEEFFDLTQRLYGVDPDSGGGDQLGLFWDNPGQR